MTPRHLARVLLVLAALPMGALAEGAGSVQCDITENGEAATGAIVVTRDGAEIARGVCGKALGVPAGSYTAAVALDGALDGPQRSQPVTVAAGATSRVSVDFQTGTIEVRIQSEGRRAAGMAIIRKDGTQVGTLGSGVSAHLSAGRYDIVARYRSQEKAFTAVVVDKGGHVTLDAAF